MMMSKTFVQIDCSWNFWDLPLLEPFPTQTFYQTDLNKKYHTLFLLIISWYLV